jgi:murein DD-endopeptidase MepM/ murein hydrolase activator NlpD
MAGNHVWVNDGNGTKTGYAHLKTITVRTGQQVRAGEQIGTMGTTGNSSGNHLDLQYWVNGVNTDPAPLIAGCWN